MLKMLSRFFLVVTLVVGLAACGGGDVRGVAEETTDTTVTLLSADASAAIGWEPWPRPTYVIRTRDEWMSVWNERYASQPCRRFNGRTCIRPAMPEFSFEQFTLVGIYKELRPAESLSLAKVELIEGRVQVFTTSSVDRTEGVGYAAVQTPFSLFFLIPQTTRAVVFSPAIPGQQAATPAVSVTQPEHCYEVTGPTDI